MEKTRGDVVFKTILRQMRKSMSDDFNKHTQYMKLKLTQKKPEFLIDMLEKYFSKLAQKFFIMIDISLKSLETK